MCKQPYNDSCNRIYFLRFNVSTWVYFAELIVTRMYLQQLVFNICEHKYGSNIKNYVNIYGFFVFWIIYEEWT
jgi:hypothetical protein